MFFKFLWDSLGILVSPVETVQLVEKKYSSNKLLAYSFLISLFLHILPMSLGKALFSEVVPHTIFFSIISDYLSYFIYFSIIYSLIMLCKKNISITDLLSASFLSQFPFIFGLPIVLIATAFPTMILKIICFNLIGIVWLWSLVVLVKILKYMLQWSTFQVLLLFCVPPTLIILLATLLGIIGYNTLAAYLM